MLSSKDYIEMDLEYGAHNYHPIPVVISRAEGVWVYDPEGNQEAGPARFVVAGGLIFLAQPAARRTYQCRRVFPPPTLGTFSQTSEICSRCSTSARLSTSSWGRWPAGVFRVHAGR